LLANPKLITKIEAEEPAQRLAVLIDADNAQAAVIEALLAEIARFGEATVRRIYGDFTAPTSAQWKKVLPQFAFKPVQQFAYTTGKNATDSTLIIDAMDLLYTSDLTDSAWYRVTAILPGLRSESARRD
jgi:NYN domain